MNEASLVDCGTSIYSLTATSRKLEDLGMIQAKVRGEAEAIYVKFPMYPNL